MTRDFNRLWFATGSANLADGVALTALPLIALTLGGTVGQIALVTTVATLAWPLVGLHAGWLVDRFPRRTILLVVNGARGLALGLLAVTALTGTLTIAGLLTAAALYGVAETLVDTALVSMIPELVAPPDRTSANARIEATINLTNQLVGPPLAGAIVGISTALTVASGSVLYLLAGGAILLIRPTARSGTRRATTEPGSSTTAVGTPDTGVRSGLRYLWRHPLQRPLTLLTAAMSVVWGAWTALFVVHAVSPGPLGLTTTQYGLLLTAMAVGGLAASTAVGRLQRRLGTALLLFIDCLGTVLLVLPVALGADIWFTAAGVTLAGAGSSIWRILVATIRQNSTPLHLLGRVYSASRVISWGAIPLGAGLAGLVADLTNLRTVFIASTVLAVLIALAFLPLWRTLEQSAASSAEPSDSTEHTSARG